MNSAVSTPPPGFKESFEKAVTLKNDGHLAEAERIFRDLLAMSPLSASTHAFLADTIWDQGNAASAVPYFRRAVELAPKSEMASLGLFHTLLESGDKTGALAEMDRFLVLFDSEEYQGLARKILR